MERGQTFSELQLHLTLRDVSDELADCQRIDTVSVRGHQSNDERRPTAHTERLGPRRHGYLWSRGAQLSHGAYPPGRLRAAVVRAATLAQGVPRSARPSRCLLQNDHAPQDGAASSGSPQEPRPTRTIQWRGPDSLHSSRQARLVALLATALERSLLARAAATPNLAISPELCVYTDDTPPGPAAPA